MNKMDHHQPSTGAAATIRYTDISTPLGQMFVAWTPRGICRIEPGVSEEAFLRSFPGTAPERDDTRRPALTALLERWFRGEPVDVSWDLSDQTAFERAVLEEVARIPRGEVRTYAEVARALGRPGAARAVGNALAKNPVPFLIPCHRVVRADGSIGHYSGGGPAVKRRLLVAEGALPAGEDEPAPAAAREATP